MSDFKVKMHQFAFHWGSAQTPLEELTAFPQTPSCILGVYC